MLVGFGKAEIHLTFDPIDEQMWRVLGVGDNADPVERRRSGEAIGKPRRDRGHLPPAHTIADAADPARPHLILRVEKPEPRGSVLYFSSLSRALPPSTLGNFPASELTAQPQRVCEILRRRLVNGRWCFGETPTQTFLDPTPTAKEKISQHDHIGHQSPTAQPGLIANSDRSNRGLRYVPTVGPNDGS